MATARSQVARANSLRLFELVFVLMSAVQPITRRQIIDLVSEYRETGDGPTLQRMFERDKQTLRELGMNLETSETDGGEAYRLRDRSFTLPEIDFTPQERAMLTLAGRVWSENAMARESQDALRKLAAAGVELDAAPSLAFQPSVSAREHAFQPLWEATARRRRVRFSYRTSTGTTSERHVEPWMLGSRSGSWYLIGFDRDRQERRSFKLSRITSEPRAEGPDASYEVPEIDRAALLASLAPAPGTQQAVLAIRGEYAPMLRRRGRPMVVVGDGPELPEGYRTYEVPFNREADLAAEVATHGADVLVVSPPALRETVIDHLQRVVAAHGGAS